MLNSVKNRVQYHRDFDEWEKYESDNFITYWYGNNQGVGQAVVQLAEYDFAYIQKMLESRMNEKVQLITYRDITDVKQSNIGAEEVFELRGNQSAECQYELHLGYGSEVPREQGLRLLHR